MTTSMLFEAYLEILEESEPERLATRRSHLRSIAKHIDGNEEAKYFIDSLDERINAYKDAVPKRGSHTPAISTLRMTLRWAYSEKLLTISPDLAESLGMPPVAVFANWREYQQAPSVYKALLAEMRIAQLTPARLDESFFEKFLAGLPSRVVAWRAGWREFLKCWETAAEEGLVPEVELPEAPLKKRKNYRIDEHDLPPHLREELKLIRNRLFGENLIERWGAQPYDGSTIELLIGSLLRLAGFVTKHRGLDLNQTESFAMVLSIEHGLALMQHVNNQWLDANEVPQEARKHFGIGEYEIGILRQFGALARVGLKDDILHEAYLEEIKYHSQRARARRERAKDPGRLNEYFRVAVELTKRGLAQDGFGLAEIRRATLTRDSLAFALFAAFGYRIGILTNLRLEEHIRHGDNGEIVISIRKEATKPGLRDLVHEVPRELIPLFNYYLNDARRVLLKGQQDHGHLFVSSHDGSPLGRQAVYAMFVTRTLDILGEIHNPHQVRKAWASDWARWTRGDYMTASSILDNSPLTIQKSYARIVREEQIDDFDNATRDAWSIGEGGAA